MNPFKFGTVVEEPFFFNRNKELERIASLMNSENHLIIFSPRRYGKTSLIKKSLKENGGKHIFLDMQLVVSPEDFAAQLLKRVYRISTVDKLKNMIRSFRIIPSVSVNPVSGEVDVSFRPSQAGQKSFEDVLNLIDKLGSPANKIIVALDEFQEIFRISKDLDRLLRPVMQNHKNVKYIFSGSSESLIRKIFENKKSPFYHFAYLMPLDLIPEKEFWKFLSGHFNKISEKGELIATEILKVTFSHPYYTRQLAFIMWAIINRSGYTDNLAELAVDEILQSHDIDYERLWYNLNRSDMKVLIGLSRSESEPLSNDFLTRYDAGPDSTVYSSLKRLSEKGIINQHNKKYRIDDPFFLRWIIRRRNQ